MKILITTSKNFDSYKLAYLLRQNEVSFGNLNTNFPKDNSPSLAHEILKFCLDEQIQVIIPTNKYHLIALSESVILFDEFDIQVLSPGVNDAKAEDFPDFVAESYSSLSAKLLQAGYPNQTLAIAKADFFGDLIQINDQKKDFFKVFEKVNALSFLQIGKLFNMIHFEPLAIYKINRGIFSLEVLNWNNELICSEVISYDLRAKIQLLFENKNLIGFYKVYYSNDKVLRIKNIAI